MKKQIKIHALEKLEAIDHSPIYLIIVAEAAKLKKGDVLRFDPTSERLEVGFDTNNA